MTFFIAQLRHKVRPKPTLATTRIPVTVRFGYVAYPSGSSS